MRHAKLDTALLVLCAVQLQGDATGWADEFGGISQKAESWADQFAEQIVPNEEVPPFSCCLQRCHGSLSSRGQT